MIIETQEPIKSYLGATSEVEEFVLFIGRETNNWKLALSGDAATDAKMAEYMNRAAGALGLKGDANRVALEYSATQRPIDQFYLDNDTPTATGVSMNAGGFNGIAFKLASFAHRHFATQKEAYDFFELGCAKKRNSPVLFADSLPMGTPMSYFNAGSKTAYRKGQLKFREAHIAGLHTYAEDRNISNKVKAIVLAGCDQTLAENDLKIFIAELQTIFPNATIGRTRFLTTMNGTAFEEILSDIKEQPALHAAIKSVMNKWIDG